MSKFTAALEIEGTDLHVTLCFCDAMKAGKLRTSTRSGNGIVTKVEYWERCNLTVALIASDFAVERHEYYKSLGYGYDYDFIPHATLGKGNIAGEYLHMIGQEVVLCSEYVRVY